MGERGCFLPTWWCFLGSSLSFPSASHKCALHLMVFSCLSLAISCPNEGLSPGVDVAPSRCCCAGNKYHPREPEQQAAAEGWVFSSVPVYPVPSIVKVSGIYQRLLVKSCCCSPSDTRGQGNSGKRLKHRVFSELWASLLLTCYSCESANTRLQ